MFFHHTIPEKLMGATLPHIDYFNMHGILERGFLHPGGKNATEKLLNHLATLQPQATVLEIGCGIGKTAKLLLDRYPYRYAGIDASPSMLKRASTRLLPYDGRSTLTECDLLHSALPLDSDSVSAIIAESVFEVLMVEQILHECHRVLQDDGLLCFNSRMWSGTTSSGERREANAFTRRLLGVPAAPEEPATIDEWTALLAKVGFEVITRERLDATRHDAQEIDYRHAQRLTTFAQMILHPSYVGYWWKNKRVENRFRHIWNKMESWMIVAKKM